MPLLFGTAVWKERDRVSRLLQLEVGADWPPGLRQLGGQESLKESFLAAKYVIEGEGRAGEEWTPQQTHFNKCHPTL